MEEIVENIDLKENEEGSADPMIEKKAADAAEKDAPVHVHAPPAAAAFHLREEKTMGFRSRSLVLVLKSKFALDFLLLVVVVVVVLAASVAAVVLVVLAASVAAVVLVVDDLKILKK